APLAGVDEYRAGRLVPGVERRAPYRIEVLVDLDAGERTERHRRIRRAKRGRADAGDRAQRRCREHPGTNDVAGLALIGAHSERGIAFDVLDRAKALAHG